MRHDERHIRAAIPENFGDIDPKLVLTGRGALTKGALRSLEATRNDAAELMRSVCSLWSAGLIEPMQNGLVINDLEKQEDGRGVLYLMTLTNVKGGDVREQIVISKYSDVRLLDSSEAIDFHAGARASRALAIEAYEVSESKGKFLSAQAIEHLRHTIIESLASPHQIEITGLEPVAQMSISYHRPGRRELLRDFARSGNPSPTPNEIKELGDQLRQARTNLSLESTAAEVTSYSFDFDKRLIGLTTRLLDNAPRGGETRGERELRTERRVQRSDLEITGELASELISWARQRLEIKLAME